MAKKKELCGWFTMIGTARVSAVRTSHYYKDGKAVCGTHCKIMTSKDLITKKEATDWKLPMVKRKKNWWKKDKKGEKCILCYGSESINIINNWPYVECPTCCKEGK